MGIPGPGEGRRDNGENSVCQKVFLQEGIGVKLGDYVSSQDETYMKPIEA